MVINWGIAAAGRITSDFVTALTTIPDNKHRVVAVADVDPERAKTFAQKHQISKFYGGFEELALDPNVNIIYVGVLNPFHYTVVRIFLERGKNVLCEKPLCLCYRQAKELYRLAKSKNVFLMEGMWSRFFPSYQRLRELLDNHAIGKIIDVQVRHGFVAESVERILNRNLGGSITLDIGLYALQLGQFVYGCAPLTVKANGLLNNDQVDVESQFVLNYGEGRTLSACVSALKNLDNCAKIVGTNGEIELYNYWCCTSLKKLPNDLECWPLPSAKFEFIHTNSCGLRYEAEEVRRCLENGLLECPLYTHDNSLELISLEDEIRRQIGVKYDDVLNTEI